MLVRPCGPVRTAAVAALGSEVQQSCASLCSLGHVAAVWPVHELPRLSLLLRASHRSCAVGCSLHLVTTTRAPSLHRAPLSMWTSGQPQKPFAHGGRPWQEPASRPLESLRATGTSSLTWLTNRVPLPSMELQSRAQSQPAAAASCRPRLHLRQKARALQRPSPRPPAHQPVCLLNLLSGLSAVAHC